MYGQGIVSVFLVYFTCKSRVYHVYFPGISGVSAMSSPCILLCLSRVISRYIMVANIYMTCVRNSDALLTCNLTLRDGSRIRTDELLLQSRTPLPTELLGLDYLTTTYTVLISCTCEEKSVVL